MMEKPNLNYLKEISGGDIIFEKKMLEIVKKELPEEIKSYKNFIELQNYNQAAEIVHKIKHKISILGLEKSYDIAVEFENNLLEGNTSLREQFESILNNITKYLTTL